ncbi:hypothetical protein DEJ36_05720 [Curtobacterium sp. MCPF17_052]|nr:hypothetical protein [Curtobacterium sp. MCPF17_052]WIB14084.1 hypothetical protein DEJ36_05720 [Curtobacterium sp. MCPF17_052]
MARSFAARTSNARPLDEGRDLERRQQGVQAGRDPLGRAPGTAASCGFGEVLEMETLDVVQLQHPGERVEDLR